ncbi:unnamed protein product [Caenorhabditis bovis]|uniref:CD36 family protein n=1 Tax=Caenorhabditis bovis TaxID=2654633 RepID=A0A8S1F0I5_9PELO|nr:unnamed protein product [Caenorhabditis bovis]
MTLIRPRPFYDRQSEPVAMRLKFSKFYLLTGLTAIILLLLGIFTWIFFGRIYNSEVQKNLFFSQNSDLSFSYSTWLFTHPPMRNTMKFFFFNLTNPDEVKYNGDIPHVVEVGPFIAMESEEKKYVEWSKKSDMMFYQNYKKYVLSSENSCQDCSWEKNIIFPNPPGLGAVTSMIDPQFEINKMGRTIIATFLLLSGEYPFVSHKVREILFDGYDDALLSAAHSKLVALISGIFKGDQGSIVPIPIPDMPRFGYFQGYNNSRDEEYWVKTGKDDINKLGEIVSWAGIKKLPSAWWSTDYSRSIRGSDSGSFNQMNLNESSKIEFFMSFMCRSFTMSYKESKMIQGIPSLSFNVPYDEWDTTSSKNTGFRYRNIEKRNYFPDWPTCPPKGKCEQSGSIDCSKSENFCHACCDGSLYNGTYLLPPGMFPLVCYPGRLQPSPFSVIYSAPHYLFSPREVFETVVGMKPNAELHDPMIYSHEPYSGTVVEVINRMQVNMPVIKSHDVPSSMNMRDIVIPLFWHESHAILSSFVYDKLWIGFVLVPKLVTSLQFIAIGLGLLIFAVLAFFKLRSIKKQ